MKIAFFTDAYFPQVNGVATSVYETTKELRRRGHEVCIIATKYPNYKDAKNESVIRLSSISVYKKLNIRIATHMPDKTLFNLYRKRFDIIHAHGGGTISLLGFEIATLRKIPIVFTYHTLWGKYKHYRLRGGIFAEGISNILTRRCDVIIAPTKKMKDELIASGVKKQISIIPNCVNTDKFNIKSTDYLHKLLKISPSIPILISVGRLGKEKNFTFLVEVFKIIVDREQKDQTENKKPHFVIIGSGPEKKYLDSLIKSLNLEYRVHLIGGIEQRKMPYVYKSAKVFVFASLTEVHPLSILEAGASGLPFIITADKAFENVVVNGKNGFALPLDKDQFAQKILDLLDSPKLMSRFAANSKILINTYFRADKVTNELISVYKQIIKEFGKKPKSFIDTFLSTFDLR